MHYFPDIEGVEFGFRPATPAQFFALQLARRLNDIGSLKRYVQLVEMYSEDQILGATQGLRNEQWMGHTAIERLEAELGKYTNRYRL